MHSWLSIQSSVLDEIVTLDGPAGHHLDLCSSCSNHQSAPLYRCLECAYSLLHCSECVVKLHKVLPLHRLEVCLFLYYTTICRLTLCSELAGWLL